MARVLRAVFVLLSVAGDFSLAEGGEPSRTRVPPPRRLTADGLPKRRPAWSPDGRRLAFARLERSGIHLWQYIWTLGDGSEPKRLLASLETPHFDAVFAPDGQRLLVCTIRFIGTQGIVDVAAVDPDGSNLTSILPKEPSEVVHQEWPAWSPDGRRFAFSSTHEGNQEIYTTSADGSDLVRLSQNPGHDAHPCWHPDGTRIAYATDRFGGGLEIVSVAPDATGLKRLTTSRGLDDYPTWSPDGRRLAFVSNRDGQFEIYVAEADGSRPTNLTAHPARDEFPTWTPDGKGITFVSDRGGATDLYVIDVPAEDHSPAN